MAADAVIAVVADGAAFPAVCACVGAVLATLPDGLADVAVIGDGLAAADLAWLAESGVRRAPSGGSGVAACAHVPDILPGYGISMVVDPRMRVLRADVPRLFLKYAARPDRTVAAVPAADPAYLSIADLRLAAAAFERRHGRLAARHGMAIADRQSVLPPFDDGIVAAQSTSPIWAAWRRRIGEGGRDAFDVAVRDVGAWFRLPTTMNWLCGEKLPWQAPDGGWFHPDYRSEPIAAANLRAPPRWLVAAEGAERVAETYRALGAAGMGHR